MSTQEPVQDTKPVAVEENKEKQRRPGPRPVPCPWCDQTKCNHCRCLGHASCNHKPGEMCPNERYKRRLVCNPCEKNKLRKQKEINQQESQMHNVVYNQPFDYRMYVNPVEVPYGYPPQQYQPVPMTYPTYMMNEEHKVAPQNVNTYTESSTSTAVANPGSIKRSTSKNVLAPAVINTPSDESIQICFTNSDDSIGVITLNPETKFLSYVRRYLYVHFIEDLKKKEFSFVQSTGDSIPLKKESSTLCSQILQSREKNHHTFNNTQIQKIIYIKSEDNLITKEAIDEANQFFISNADKRVKLETHDPSYPGSTVTPTVSKSGIPTTSTGAAPSTSQPSGVPINRTPSYPFNPNMTTPYYAPSLYYMSQPSSRYLMNNYNGSSMPNVLSYGSLPANLNGSYNSLSNYYNRLNRRDVSYTSMDYFDTPAATTANGYLPDNEINVLENTPSNTTKPTTAPMATLIKPSVETHTTTTIPPVSASTSIVDTTSIVNTTNAVLENPNKTNPIPETNTNSNTNTNTEVNPPVVVDTAV